MSIGNIFNINNSLINLTCFHCIKNTDNQSTIIKNDKYDSHITHVSDELELALLNVDKMKYKYKFWGIDDLYLDSNIKNMNMYIQTININKYMSNNKFEPITIKCTFKGILQSHKDKITSMNIPQIPFYAVTLNQNFSDISELTGISGSFLMSDKKILGMVSAIENSIVYVIPSYAIYRFLAEIKSTKLFNGICTLVGNFTICNFPKNENSTIITNGVYVENTFDINYNNYPYKDKNDKDNNKIAYANLKKNDIIIKINNIRLNEKGYIYDKKFNESVDFRTYIALNYTCGSIINLEIMRCTSGNNDYKKKNIMVRARPLYSLKYIPISFNNNLYEYKGLIFAELSEDIINNYINVGIYIGTSVSDYYLTKPYRSEIAYLIVLIDINKIALNDKLLKCVNDLGLPLVNNNKSYSIPYVTKLNKKKLCTLDEFKNAIETNEESIIKLNVYNSNKLKIIIKNNGIEEIKIDT